MLETLDGLAVRLWARASLDALGRAREEIDALNVFPVPDGDTGTNLFLTFECAVEAVAALDAGPAGGPGSDASSSTGPSSSPASDSPLGSAPGFGSGSNPGSSTNPDSGSGTGPSSSPASDSPLGSAPGFGSGTNPGSSTNPDSGPGTGSGPGPASSPAPTSPLGFGPTADPGGAAAALALNALATGAMTGAHGNSGVILSQLLRGLADEVAAAVRAGRPVGPRTLAAALADAAESAWQAVSAPAEGTMLSVARAAADAAALVVLAATKTGGPEAEPSFAALAEAAATAASAALDRTPEQLAVLRVAGVVDAGGRGVCILLDVLAALLGGYDPVRAVSQGHRLPPRPQPAPEPAPSRPGQAPAPRLHSNPFATDQFEVVYLIDLPEAQAAELRSELERLCADGSGDSLVIAGGDGRYRVHVHVSRPGPVIEATIRFGRPYDLRIELLEHRAAGRVVLAAAAGPGIAELFAQAGATPLPCLPGRPPTSVQLIQAILDAAVNEVVVLVNDEQGLAAAAAAAEQIHRNSHQANTAGIRVAVVPTKSVVQGIAALAVHEPGRRFDADVVAMSAAAGATRHGALQIAADDAWTMAGVCRAGDVLGLIDGDVALIAESAGAAALALVDRMVSAGGEMVTLVTGQVPGVDADALVEAVTTRVQAQHPEMDVIAYAGGQDGWPLLIGVE